MSLLPMAVQPRRTARLPRPHTPLHHVAFLQGFFAILIDLHSVKPNLSTEERNQFLLQDLAVGIPPVIVFMVPSMQLLCIGFIATGPCQGLPWTGSKLASPGLLLTEPCLWLVTL
jgi:hypothetical protein